MLTDQIEETEPIQLLTEKENNNDVQNSSKILQSVLVAKTNLLKPVEHKVFDSYEKSGTNGSLESLPKIVKIRGFEINKKVSVKIQILNKSKFSQRFTIVAPSTPFFKIKYTRKGNIAPGLSEALIITFTPQNYEYYYDYIRIFCEGDKFIIPIHAFPKMNIHVKEYVPKFVEFGSIPLNSEAKKEFELRNILDKPFEYELVPLKINKEITIEPTNGSIDQFSSKTLKIKFSPLAYGFFQSEYEFRLSEMDYQPVVITISGYCNAFDKIMNENILKHMKKMKDNISSPELSIIKKPVSSKIHIDGISDFKLNIDNEFENELLEVNEDKITGTQIHSRLSVVEKIEPQSEQKQPNSNTTTIKFDATKNPSPSKGISKKFKNFPSNKEREFLNYFNGVDGKIKDKEIKYIQFIGKCLLTNDEVNKIVNDRIKDYETNLMIRRKIDINRHSFECDSEKVIVDRTNSYLVKPTFNFNQNDKFFKTRHYFSVFLKNMTKVLINNRADKNLGKLKAMISNNNITSTEDYAKFVEQDWVNQFNRDSDNGEDKIRLKFIRPKNLTRETVYLAYDFNLDSLKQVLPYENNINLELLSELKYIEKNDVEVIGYKEFKSLGLANYEISTEDKLQRICGETEQVVRGERGDSEMTYEKVLSLLELPESYKSHIDLKMENVLFNNPSLKKYVSFNNFVETSIDYNLQLRPVKEPELGHSVFANELHNKLPLSIYENINCRELDKYNLIGDTTLDFVPSRIESPDEKDLNIKHREKVDEDNYIFEIPYEDEEKLIAAFEKDDEVIKNMRELNKDEVFSIKNREKITLENYLQLQKRKWMATVPTVLEFYNSGVVQNNNKFIL